MSDESPLAWTDDGQPRSRLYGDVYFSAEDGLAETRAVFLQGCGLPQAWAGRRAFTVGELGFGTGLNILALLDLWRRSAPPGGRLHVFSIEAHPITAQEAARALSRWPELADLAGLLVRRWPGRARGFHRIDLPELGAVLDLAVMDVESALAEWSGQADAWFLDGFSPALNPAMWREEIMALVAARSAPGARAATFTVAGAVRRGLAAAGFEVEKRPGFGRKRERLEARLPGAVSEPPFPRVAVVGAGIAGAGAARALRALGCDPVVLDAEGPGAGASGNPAALVTPRLDAGLGPLARLFAQAFARAGRLYDEPPDAIIARSVLQLAGGERDLERFGKIAAADLFEPGALSLLEVEAASARLGEPSPAPALDLAAALVVEPAAILSAWIGPVLRAEVASLAPTDGGWRLLDAAGGTIVEAEAVILTIGPAIGALLDGLPIGPVRGQASWTRAARPAQAAAWGGYAVPTRDGLLFGATHDRGETATDLRAADHERNRATLAAALPGLAARLVGAELDGRASVRAATPDHLPLAGAALGLAGVHVLAGLGSRGFCLAPLLAEHVAAQVLGAPSPLPAPLAELVAPDRFRKRAARKGHSLAPQAAKGA
ncbi:tRNA (5-methylaminomethyl-2-thiouridine)(34)-methyltransferase MnmD [Phenylobacterium sp.]|uniref:tRNA (5-methylaminomethyl-2-thiouridine)(34)-methyltransferase MnmD n=1 Tax=Phenylobacterium sp. TaxID=1871053 RepID=UPI0028994069|nr:tRNA (5-methylaminomethyl-2-thiouridine)(34)-methyltransferase MnmD [Phenylobacterium sp.]